MSKRLDILGARIFGASICHARKYLQPFQKCPNVWTKFPNLAIMHKYKLHIIRIKTCICAFCYFINFLHTFLDIFRTNVRLFSRQPDSMPALAAFFYPSATSRIIISTNPTANPIVPISE